MSKKIHFYAPATNDYISPASLFSVARITVSDDGVQWLETQWVDGGDIPGMALYNSILDAAIAAEALNQGGSSSEWQVYPFCDLIITEMMINTKAHKSHYGIMLVNAYRHEEFVSYCESMETLNSQPLDLIKEHARNAVSAPLVTKKPMISDASQYCVSTCSGEKEMWIVSSLAVSDLKPANKLH